MLQFVFNRGMLLTDSFRTVKFERPRPIVPESRSTARIHFLQLLMFYFSKTF